MHSLPSHTPTRKSTWAWSSQAAPGLGLAWPIGLAITGLLVIVAMSYLSDDPWLSIRRRFLYRGAREPGHAAWIGGCGCIADRLPADAAVSLTAGVDAIASAFPALWPYRIEIALALLCLITHRQPARLARDRHHDGSPGLPVPVHLPAHAGLRGDRVIHAREECRSVSVAPAACQPLTLFLILHTFATGCTALTGIEAISNGVPAFKSPESKNAGRTLIVMAILMGILFVGSIGLTQFLGVIAGPHETILSALARRLLGSGPRLCTDPDYRPC